MQISFKMGVFHKDLRTTFLLWTYYYAQFTSNWIIITHVYTTVHTCLFRGLKNATSSSRFLHHTFGQRQLLLVKIAHLRLEDKYIHLHNSILSSIELGFLKRNSSFWLRAERKCTHTFAQKWKWDETSLRVLLF